MTHKYFDRWRGIALILWSVCCLLPGVLVALNQSPGARSRVERLSQLYGHEMGGYLGYCPSALLAYVLPSLVLSPVILLLGALGAQPDRANALRHAVRQSAAWAALNGFGLLVITLLLGLQSVRENGVSGWAFALWKSLLFSGLPSLGLAVLVATAFRSRRAALLVGLLVTGLTGVIGIYARSVGVSFLPGGIDQLLFSGTNDSWLRGAVFACGWFALWMVMATLRVQLQQRRSSTATL